MRRSVVVRHREKKAQRARVAPWLCALLVATIGCDVGTAARAAEGPDLPEIRSPTLLLGGGPGAVVEDEPFVVEGPTLELAGRFDDAGVSSVHPLDQRPEVETAGLDSALLATAFERAAALPRLHNMIIARHGGIVAERHVRGPGLEEPANVKSASKSVLSALVGIAIDEGYLQGTDQLVAPFFASYLSGATEPARARITLGHLLTMRTGLESTSNRNYGRWVASPDWVASAITQRMVGQPGQRMIYSTGNSHLASAVLTQATGQSTYEYARTRLAEPLGFELPPWPQDPQGIYFGGNDMMISAHGLLRFGELYRNGGVLDGRRVLSEDWVRRSWQVVTRSVSRGRGTSRGRYGMGWWGKQSNGYEVRFAWGYGGQFVFVVPALELTAVFTSDPSTGRESSHNRAIHRILDELIVPAAIAGAGAP
jgi:CubicO group peptidase (beta-lactamase class C family)